MKFMPTIDIVALTKLRIIEVEEKMEVSQESIEQLTEVNKEVINECLLKPI
jgi:hypothetical protein